MSTKTSSGSPNRGNSPTHQRTSTLINNAQSTGSSWNKVDRVKKNSKGGVLITSDEITQAFKMLDIENNGIVTLQILKKRLGALFPELTAKDYRFLMNNKREMNIDDINALLIDNEITNFDPVLEAFKVFDNSNTGSLDTEKLRQAFLAFGLGELSDEEIQVLIRTADVDRDGEIKIDDFRNIFDPNSSISSISNNNNSSKKAKSNKFKDNTNIFINKVIDMII